jgi:hypothetical protein
MGVGNALGRQRNPSYRCATDDAPPEGLPSLTALSSQTGLPPYDRLLDFSFAKTGNLFFVPSATFLETVGNGSNGS